MRVEPPTDDNPPPPHRFTLSFGIDALTTYQFRGFVYEDTGPIVQPWADLEVRIAESDSAAVRLLLGTWHSFHGQATGAETDDAFRKYWFEADVSAGIGFDVSRWTMAVRYNRYMSPSDAWPTMQEISLALSYTDDWLPENWTLNPHALLAFEVGPAANDGLRNGVFLEVGVCPSYAMTEGPCEGVELSFPIAVGLSLSNYYEDGDGRNDPFGFFSLGAAAMIPLGRTGPGEWNLHVGFTALMLGDAAASFNEGDRSVLVGSIGIAVEF